MDNPSQPNATDNAARAPQADTPAFEAWFGKSKAVDAAGLHMREKAAEGLPMFSWMADASATSSEPNRTPTEAPSTVALVQTAVIDLIGGNELPNQLGRVVVATAADIQSEWQPLIRGKVQLDSKGVPGLAQAFYEPVTRTAYFIADHIAQGDESAVIGHEMMHKHGQAVLGKAGWDKLHATINTWANAQSNTDERAVYDYARAKVEAVGVKLSSQEMFPYAVEAAQKRGIKPGLAARSGTVANWLASVKQSMAMIWSRVIGRPETFSAQDLVDLAFGIAQMENPDRAPWVRDALRGANKKGATTPDASEQNLPGRPLSGMQERPVRAVSGSEEPTQFFGGAGSAVNRITIKKAEQAAISAANAGMNAVNKRAIDEELRSIAANGNGVDISDLAQNPKYWDAEDEQLTDAGYAEYDRLNLELAKERATVPSIEELSDLEGADQDVQHEAFAAYAEQLGLDVKKSFSSGGSRYVNVEINGKDYKFRFADHFNTVRATGMQPDFNVAPGRSEFTEAFNYLLRKLNEPTAPDGGGAPMFSLAKAESPAGALAFARGTNEAMTNNDVGNQGGRSADDSTPGVVKRLQDQLAKIEAAYEPLRKRKAFGAEWSDVEARASAVMGQLSALTGDPYGKKTVKLQTPSDDALNAEYSSPKDVPQDVRAWVQKNSSILTSDATDAVRWGRIADTLKDDRYPSGDLTIYRAVADGDEIRAGDWVTTERRYAEMHLSKYLSGKGQILEETVNGRDVLVSPTGDNEEAIYAPRSLSGPVENEPTAPDSGGAPLSESKFYSQYRQHILRAGTDINAMVRDGFKAGIGPNLLPASRGGNPTNISEQKYNPKAGDMVLLVPKEGWRETPNGDKVIDGWKPQRHQVIEVEHAGQSMYVLFQRSQATGAPAAQTDTPAFKKWFGDSKVVDADGSPLVVYHGTNAEFDSFDNSKTAANDRGLWGRGHYFSAVVDGPNSYALRQGDGAQVMPSYVSIKNPLVLKTGSDLVTRLPDGTDYRELVGPNLDGVKIKEMAISGGHDGVIQIRQNGLIGDVVAYTPEQIKSAIGNSGDFNPESANILYSFAGQRAATSDGAELHRAQQALTDGQAAELVRQNTGWHRGVDGAWRFEVSDDTARLLPILKSLATGGYEAKPIKSVTYKRNDDDTFEVTLSPHNPQTTRDFVCLHAVGPVVLEAVVPEPVLSKILKGDGEPDLIGNLDDAKRIHGDFAFDGFNALPLDQVLYHPALFAAYPSLRSLMVQVDPALGIDAALVSTEAEGHVMRIGPYQQLTAMLHEIQHWVQEFEGFARGGRPTVYAAQSSPEYKAWLKASRALPMSPTARDVETVMSLYDRIPSTVQAYRRLAGEVEARNSQKRQSMTAAQRQATSPESTADIAGEENAVSKAPTDFIPRHQLSDRFS
jgi:hypothetical protein